MRDVGGRRRGNAFVGALLLGLVAATAGLPGGVAAAAAGEPVRVPVGPDDVTYQHLDDLVLGPAAVAVADDGAVWVADAAKQRLLRYGTDGRRLATIDVAPHRSKGVYGLRATGGRVYLGTEDPATERNHVLAFTDAGRFVASHPHPPGTEEEDGLTSLHVTTAGAIVLEREWGASYLELVDAAGRQTNRELPGRTEHGRRYAVTGIDWHHTTVQAGSVHLDVPLDHGGGARFLGAQPDGTFFLEVADVSEDRVDAQVRRHSVDGRYQEVHRRDLRGQRAEVGQYYDDGPGGQLYGVDASATHLTVGPLQYTRTLPPLLPPAPARRLAAVDNVEAALVWSRLAFPTGAEAALLGRDDVFADALASSGAQGALGAPLLLTGGARLDRDVAAELRRLGVKRVHLLGGRAAIGPAVEDTLLQAGYAVTRSAGATRVETAVALAETALPAADTAILTRAFAAGGDPTRAFADSLAVGGWAAERRWPVLLTHRDALSPPARAYLRRAGIRRVYIAGGTAAIDEGVADELAALGIGVTRVAGADRAATATAVAMRRGGTPGEAVLLDGSRADAWAPGLTAAGFAALRGAPVLLTAGETLPAPTRSWLQQADRRPVRLVCSPFTHHRSCSAGVAAAGWR